MRAQSLQVLRAIVLDLGSEDPGLEIDDLLLLSGRWTRICLCMDERGVYRLTREAWLPAISHDGG